MDSQVYYACMPVRFHFHYIAGGVYGGVIPEAPETGYSQMIGSFLLTASGRILIFDFNQTLVVNQIFSHTKELPLKSGIYQTAQMTVINNVAYIGGQNASGNGIAYLVTLPIEYLEEVSARSNDLAAGAQVTVTNITLPVSCIIEVFAHSADEAIAACFSHENSTLYIVNLHSPFDKSEPLQFTPRTDFSNVVPVEDAFYFVQHGHLFRADIASGANQVAILEHCVQAWITTNEHYSIIIECENKSFVYVPKEWSDAYGIKYGAWNWNVQLKPCHGTTFVFSVVDTIVTIYDYRNDFHRRITLTGNPDTTTLLCSQNNGILTLLNRDKSWNIWIQHILTEQYEIKASNVIPYSEGTLPPLPVGNNRTVPQSALVFNSTYFLLPATHQLFFDLQNNITHPMITDDIVVFHAGIYSVSNSDSDGDIVKLADSYDNPAQDSNDKQLLVYVMVPVVLLLVVAAVGCLAHQQKHRILRYWNNTFRW